MATAHFSKIVKIRTEAHDMPELKRTYVNLLLDTVMYDNVINHEEVVLVFDGKKSDIIQQLIDNLQKHIVGVNHDG